MFKGPASLLSELARALEAGEVVLVRAEAWPETAEAPQEFGEGQAASETELTGEVDWTFTTRQLPKRSFGDHVESFGRQVEKLERSPFTVPESYAVDSPIGWPKGIRDVVQARADWAFTLSHIGTSGKMTGLVFREAALQSLHSLDESVQTTTDTKEIRRLQEAKEALQQALEVAGA